MILHHLEQSRSHRLVWLLEELGLDYEIKMYYRDPETFRAPPELREVHSLGKAPLLTDNGVVFAETGAIIEHVLEAHGEGRLQPAPDTDEARQFRYFMHYAEGSLMPPLLVRFIFDRIQETKMPFFVKPIARGIAKKIDETFTNNEMKLHAQFLNATLEKQTWFAGDSFTAADIQMSYPVESLLSRGRRPEQEIQHLKAYVERIRQRPAYQRALEKA